MADAAAESTLIDKVRNYYGAEPRYSPWNLVEQATINKFGEATLDFDWLHTDPERAKQDGPFGGPIAYGFWTISMLTHLSRQSTNTDYPEGALFGLNYGFDRIRMMSPVPIGKRIRLKSRLLDIEERGPGRLLVKTENTVEVEGVEKPAMIAEWLCLFVFPTNG